MQSLAGSSEIHGTGAVPLTDHPAACAGASPTSHLPAPCSLSLSQLSGALGMTETITPCASSHLDTVMPCDSPCILEVTLQLNVVSQPWKKSFQLLPDRVECDPDNEEWAS